MYSVQEIKVTSWKDKVQLQAQHNRQEIVKAKLDRREMMRLGLLTAGGSLVLKQGLSSRAFGAVATLTDPDGTLATATASPPVRPWVVPMPRLVEKQDVKSHAMLHGEPDGTTPIDGATKRIPHQYCSYNPITSVYGASTANPTYNFAPQKFYELTAQETSIKLHPDYSATKMWAFDGVVPGPLIKAKYGEPVMVRFHNHLPSVKTPGSFDSNYFRFRHTPGHG